MINHVTARAQLASIVEDAVPAGTTVYRSGLEPLAEFPAVVVGMPSWSVDPSSFWTDRSTFPVAVILQRPGYQDPETVDVLEALWQVITEALRTASVQDQTLSGICKASAVQHSEFGNFNVQQQDYPAQVIFVDLFG